MKCPNTNQARARLPPSLNGNLTLSQFFRVPIGRARVSRVMQEDRRENDQALPLTDGQHFCELLTRAKSGSAEALGQLVEVNQNYLLLIANQEVDSNLQAKLGASDVVQETLAAAHRNFQQFEGESPEGVKRLAPSHPEKPTTGFDSTVHNRHARRAPRRTSFRCRTHAGPPANSTHERRRTGRSQASSACHGKADRRPSSSDHASQMGAPIVSGSWRAHEPQCRCGQETMDQSTAQLERRVDP